MAQRIGGIAAVVLAGVVWFLSGDFPGLPEGHPGPGLFPRVIAIGLLVAGAVLAVQSFRAERAGGEGGAPEGTGHGLGRVALVVLALALYPFLNERLGFIPTVSAACFLVAMLLKARPLAGAITAIAGTIAIYVVFTRLLGVPI